MKIMNTVLVVTLSMFLNAGEPDSIYVKHSDEQMVEVLDDAVLENLTEIELQKSIDSVEQIIQEKKQLISKMKLQMRKFSKYYGFDTIPCQSMYKKWDVKNTFNYSRSIWEKDSIIDLPNDILKMEFAFPIQDKPEYKYHATITSEFGERDGKPHDGVDVELHVNDSVYSCFSGVVRMSKKHGGYGRVVIVRHDNGLETLYGHLHRFKVKPGDRVEPGQLIGLGGSSGHSTGSHLHFETRYKGRTINPEYIIDFKNKKLAHTQIALRRNKKGYVAFDGSIKYHRVVKRESMYRICKRYGLYLSELRALNGLKENKKFADGDLVRIR